MLLRIEMGFCGTTKQRVGRESSAIVEKKGNSNGRGAEYLLLRCTKRYHSGLRKFEFIPHPRKRCMCVA